jgi:hypothetical protein
MAKKESELKGIEVSGFVLGILSIVFSLFQPLGAFILGIIAIVQTRKSQKGLGRKGKIMGIIGTILSVLVFGALIALSYYMAKNPSPFGAY